jgi:hypothetical protein
MYIYVITDGKNHKIGISKAPKRRLKQLQTACAQKLQLIKTYKVTKKNARKLEHQLHKMFWQSRLRHDGEWFALSTAHLEVLEEWLTNYLDKS